MGSGYVGRGAGEGDEPGKSHRNIARTDTSAGTAKGGGERRGGEEKRKEA